MSEPTATQLMQQIWEALDGPSTTFPPSIGAAALVTVLADRVRQGDLAVLGLRELVVEQGYRLAREAGQ